LFMNNRAVSQNLEKLSTGMRINRASDDAAGLAISEGLRTQVRGQQQAKRNALDGISALNIVEGAMDEIHNIMQRQRELAVQSANNTYSDTERAYMDAEFQALSEEIDRIKAATNFNGIRLFSDPDRNIEEDHFGANESNRGARAAWDARFESNMLRQIERAIQAWADGESINGAWDDDHDLGAAGDAAEQTSQIMEDVKTALENLKTSSNNTRFASDADVDALVTALNTAVGGNITITYDEDKGIIEFEVDTFKRAANGDPEAHTVEFNFAISKRPELEVTTFALGTQFNGSHLWVDANDRSSIDSLEIRYGRVDRVEARIDGIDATNAQSAITAMDTAIRQISEARSDIGALVNRLESTISNLTNSITNQQAAESQIRDVDFANEASKFTTSQILVQSATSMLAQANASTQGVLSLLR